MTALNSLLKATPFRLAALYLAGSVLAAALIFSGLDWRANQLLTERTLETIEAEVAGLREQFQSGGVTQLAAAVAERAREPGNALYFLSDATSGKLAGNLSRLPPELRVPGPGGLFSYIRTAAAPETRGAVGIPLAVPGGLVLVVGRDIDDQRRFVEMNRKVGLLGLGALSLLGLGGGILISRAMLRRVDNITAASRAIIAGDLSQRIPRDASGDEFDRLSENLNQMLTRIEQLMGSLREVSDNIAHDLKTPLTRLRNRAEAALRDPQREPAYRDGLVKTIEEADELIKTFNALLLIARLEGGAVAESLADVDPAAVVRDVVELYEPSIEEAGLTLATHLDDGLALRANRQLIGQAIANLVDNAIKYSPRGSTNGAHPLSGEIAVSVKRAGTDIEIAVADRGPGIPAEDRARALKRFVRLEKSRSAPGSGLGLSLVAAVASLHGGSVRLDDNAPGLRVVLVLPRAPDRAPIVAESAGARAAI